MEERVITVPLGEAKQAPGSKRANRAVKVVYEHLAKSFSVDEDDINVDGSINEEIWSNGRSNIPSKIRVRAAKFEDGVVEAELAV